MVECPVFTNETLHLDTFLWEINCNHCLVHDNIVTFHYRLFAKYFYKYNITVLYVVNDMIN